MEEQEDKAAVMTCFRDRTRRCPDNSVATAWGFQTERCRAWNGIDCILLETYKRNMTITGATFPESPEPPKVRF